jgi:outer membrane protein assembly factor BamB
MNRSLVLGALLILSSITRAAENWPSWRGTNGNGIASAQAKPPLKWDEKTHIKWKVPISGSGSATPVVWGDQVFVVTAVKTDRIATDKELPKPDSNRQIRTEPPKQFYRFEVISFDRNTGKERWRKTAAEKVPHEGHHQTHSYAAGSPTTDGKRLYVSFGSFGIYAYDLDGKLLWSRDLGKLSTRLGWGEAVTPVVHGETVVLNWDQEADSKVIALNATNGETTWEVKRDEKTSWNTPCLVDYQGITQVILNGTSRIRSYDLSNGKEIWQCGGMTVNAIPTVLADSNFAYAMSGYQKAAAVAIPLDSKGDVTNSQSIPWRASKGTPYVPSPLLHDGRLYFTAGNSNLLNVLEAKTGKSILSNERLPGVANFYASPIVASGRIYLVDRAGTTLVIKATDKLEVLATNKLNEAIDASPVAVDQQLFLRGEHHLFCIE